MICSPDFSGHTRGKSFPVADLDSRLTKGIGWVPTNVQITAFDSIADSPFGSLGDLLMIADPETQVRVDFGDGSPQEHFFFGTIHHTDGTPWECCLRGRLAEALRQLKAETGLNLLSAFEMEFQFLDTTSKVGPGFSLSGFREKKAFGESYLGALRQAGVAPDSFLREWGGHQYEVTMHPQEGIRAADHALIIRELARATAQRLEDPITFTPLRDLNGAGNGVHIHLSFVDDDGEPQTHDLDGPGGLSTVAGQFVAGVLHHLPDITALTAPSVISYARLAPHRWSAAFNNLGYRDREASLRICPVAALPGLDTAKQFNVEFRAGDSAASPHLQQAAIVYAGLDGIRQELAPPAPTQDDLSLLSTAQLQERGFRRLPGSLQEALALFAASDAVKSWFGELFVDVYVKHKEGELAFLEGKTKEEACQAYEQVY
ncbi:MAG: glutamine synthetase family protein [Pseudomonadota bacterium]